MNNIQEIYTLIERMGNLLKAETRLKGAELGLQPVQHDALYYLSICNRYSDHLLALTKFLGLTKGTVSQTLKIVENKGLIIKAKDATDKRLTHIHLTEAGWLYIEESTPPENFVSTLSSLSEKQQDDLVFQLRQCLLTYQNFNKVSGFGICRTCRYNQQPDDDYFCSLVGQKLSVVEVEKICIEFEA